MTDKPKRNKPGTVPFYDDITGPEEMQKRITAYFKKCDRGREIETVIKGQLVKVKKRVPKLISGLCLALGFKSRTSLLDYKDKNVTMMNIITRAKLECEDDAVEGGLMGEYESRIVGLNVQTNYKYTTKSEDTVKADATITINKILYKGASGIDFDKPQDSDDKEDQG